MPEGSKNRKRCACPLPGDAWTHTNPHRVERRCNQGANLPNRRKCIISNRLATQFIYYFTFQGASNIDKSHIATRNVCPAKRQVP